MHCTYSNSPHPFTDAATTHGLTVDLFHLSECNGPSLIDNHIHEWQHGLISKEAGTKTETWQGDASPAPFETRLNTGRCIPSPLAIYPWPKVGWWCISLSRLYLVCSRFGFRIVMSCVGICSGCTRLFSYSGESQATWQWPHVQLPHLCSERMKVLRICTVHAASGKRVFLSIVDKGHVER